MGEGQGNDPDIMRTAMRFFPRLFSSSSTCFFSKMVVHLAGDGESHLIWTNLPIASEAGGTYAIPPPIHQPQFSTIQVERY